MSSLGQVVYDVLNPEISCKYGLANLRTLGLSNDVSSPIM